MKALAAGAGFFARRLFQALLVMLAILVIAFAVRTSLGDPLREIMGQAVPESERAELRHELGLDAPWPVQLVRYLGRAATGDLGTSIIYKTSDGRGRARQVPRKLRAGARRKPHRAAPVGARRRLCRGAAAERSAPG